VIVCSINLIILCFGYLQEKKLPLFSTKTKGVVFALVT